MMSATQTLPPPLVERRQQQQQQQRLAWLEKILWILLDQ
jgi:hypothetical protein